MRTLVVFAVLLLVIQVLPHVAADPLDGPNPICDYLHEPCRDCALIREPFTSTYPHARDCLKEQGIDILP